MKPIPMTAHQRVALAQLREEDAVKWQIIGDLEQIKQEDFPKIVDRLNLEDFPLWPQFLKALLRPLKHRIAELIGDPDQGYYIAKNLCWVVAKAIQGKIDLVTGFLLHIDPMDTTADQEETAIVLLKEMYDSAWYQVIEVLTPPLYRKLHEIIGGGNDEKIVDYTNEILTLVGQALEEIK